MSAAFKPSGKPVKPPIPNIGKNAKANNIGTVKRIEPPHKLNIIVVKMTTDGIEMIIVVIWKKALIFVPMPVRYIWCAQTMNDMNPRKITDQTRALYP